MTTTFVYKALGSNGQANSGVLAAESRAAAIAELTGRGLHPLEVVEEQGGVARRAKVVGRKGRVSQRSVEAFTRELANLLGAGVPLARSLSLLRREAAAPTAKYLWGEIHDDVVGGTSLADTLAKWRGTFSSVYVAMVRAGEAGGVHRPGAAERHQPIAGRVVNHRRFQPLASGVGAEAQPSAVERREHRAIGER